MRFRCREPHSANGSSRFAHERYDLVIELLGQNLYAWRGGVRKRRIFFGQFEQFVDAF
jgi:hypothetical protein